MNMGAQMLKEVASKPLIWQEMATRATVGLQEMVTAGAKYVAAGANPMDLKK